MYFDDCVDAQGLACPMPLLKAKLALNQLPEGAILKIMATDAGAQRDIPSFAELAGHQLMHTQVTEQNVYIFLLKKGSAS